MTLTTEQLNSSNEKMCGGDSAETIEKNPKSWAAWKREAERLQAIIDANREAQPVALNGWHVTVTRTGDRQGIASISGPGVFCMEVPVEFSMLDFMESLTAPPAPAVPDGWIACSIRMPEPNKFVQVSNGAWVGIGMYSDADHFEDDERWQDEHCEFIDLLHHPVTHWMPLSAPPQEV